MLASCGVTEERPVAGERLFQQRGRLERFRAWTKMKGVIMKGKEEQNRADGNSCAVARSDDATGSLAPWALSVFAGGHESSFCPQLPVASDIKTLNGISVVNSGRGP